MNSKRTIKIIGIVLCSLLVLGILAGGALVFARPLISAILPEHILQENNSHDDNHNRDETTNTSGITESADYITESAAKSIALDHAGIAESDLDFISIHLDQYDFIPEYEIEFWHDMVEYDYEINAYNGEIISYESDIEFDNDFNQSQGSSSGNNGVADSNYIGKESATDIAFQDAGVSKNDASYIQSQLDYDNGHAEYEIDWRIGNTEYDYTIEAVTGAIKERDIDYDN